MGGSLTPEQEELLDLRDEVFELRNECFILKQTLALYKQLLSKHQIKTDAPGRTYDPPKSWNLRPQEKRFLSALVEYDGAWISHEITIQILSSGSVESTFGSAKSAVSTLRRKLRVAGFDVRIENLWGRGYRISQEHRAFLIPHMTEVSTSPYAIPHTMSIDARAAFA